jgi:Sporulation and spore germination/Immunoglobulin-like domain of bacterial spore germination
MSDDDVYAERLRQVLNGEGSAMEIGDDGLARILNSAHAPGAGSRRPSWLAPLAVAAAAVVLLGGTAIAVGLHHGSTNNNALPVASGSSSTPSASSSPTGSTSTSQPSQQTSTSVPPSTGPSQHSSTPVVTPARALAIYYVANVPGVGTRLYREFHALPVPTAVSPAFVALNELLGGSAVDPDYTSLWPSGTVVRSGGGGLGTDTATVNLSQLPTGSAAAKALAIQQLVWTMTAADPSIKRVQVNLDSYTGVVKHGTPVGRVNALDVLANVWILAPTDGASVTSPVKVTVYGTGFEGNVPVEIFSNGTQVAAQALTTQMGAFAQASTTFKLPAGTYEVRAFNDNGKNGTMQLWDTKTFTVS